MGLDGTLKAMMRQTVTVTPFSGRDSYGADSYGTAVTYPAREQAEQRLIKDTSGRDVLAQTTVYIGPNSAGNLPGLGLKDKLTLSDGSTPPILTAKAVTDEAGEAHHERVICG